MFDEPSDQPALEPPDIGQLKRMFDDFAWSATTVIPSIEGDLPDHPPRLDSLVSRDYYDGRQLSQGVRSAAQSRRQPLIYENLIRSAVNGILGVQSQNQTDPRAYPRKPGADDAADVASDALRYVEDVTQFDATQNLCLNDGLVEGAYAVMVQGAPEEDPTIEQIPWSEFFYDPRSRQPDYSDARFMGISKWMDADTVAQTWPEGDTAALARDYGSSGDISSFAADQTWDDRPETDTAWASRSRRRLRVVEVYYLERGKWLKAVYCPLGVLEHGLSPYVDERGATVCPIVGGSAYIDRQNNRYGYVRDLRPMQDEVNLRRQKMLHELSVRQIQLVDQNAPAGDVETARREASRPDGVIPPGWQIVNRSDVVQGHYQLLQDARGQIERLGPNPAILGRQGADASGRAQQIRQAAGMTELDVILGRHRDWVLRVYKAVWARIRQFWKGPRWVRVVGEDAPRFVQVNEVVAPPQPMIGPDGQPQIDPQTGQPAMSPPQMKSHVAEMDVDIIVEVTPHAPSLEQEARNELMRLLGTNPAWLQQIPLPLAIELSGIPKSREMVQKVDQAHQQASQAQAQQQQQAGQMAQAKMAGELEELRARIANIEADTRKKEVDTTVSAINAHIDVASFQNPPPGPTGDTGGLLPQ